MQQYADRPHPRSSRTRSQQLYSFPVWPWDVSHQRRHGKSFSLEQQLEERCYVLGHSSFGVGGPKPYLSDLAATRRGHAGHVRCNPLAELNSSATIMISIRFTKAWNLAIVSQKKQVYRRRVSEKWRERKLLKRHRLQQHETRRRRICWLPANCRHSGIISARQALRV